MRCRRTVNSSSDAQRHSGSLDPPELSLVEFCQLVDFLLDIVSLVRLFSFFFTFIFSTLSGIFLLLISVFFVPSASLLPFSFHLGFLYFFIAQILFLCFSVLILSVHFPFPDTSVSHNFSSLLFSALPPLCARLLSVVCICIHAVPTHV